MAKNILLLDDEEIIAKSLGKLLNAQGYRVTIARSGREAIEKVKEDDFHLFISDIGMPDMDGLETIQSIRKYLKDSNKQPIPEVLITGYLDLDKYEGASALRVNDCLFKPFDNSDFLQSVKNTIG